MLPILLRIKSESLQDPHPAAVISVTQLPPSCFLNKPTTLRPQVFALAVPSAWSTCFLYDHTAGLLYLDVPVPRITGLPVPSPICHPPSPGTVTFYMALSGMTTSIYGLLFNLPSSHQSINNKVSKSRALFHLLPFFRGLALGLARCMYYGLNCVPQVHVLKSSLPDHLWRQGFTEVINTKSLGRTLIQYNWCPYKKRRFRYRHKQRKDGSRRCKKPAMRKARRQARMDLRFPALGRTAAA